jgi:LCP family protein required for cell wall assembly
VEIPNDDGTFFESGSIRPRYGELYNYRRRTPVAADTILRNLSVKVDYYVIIDFQGFEEVIEGLGGIDIDVPEALYDPTYSETEAPGDYFPLDFEPGLQHMDGQHALGYARSRYNSSDLDRIQRQQRVIFAAMDKALSLNALSNALDLWKSYKHTIDTDVNDLQIAGFADLAASIPPERMSALSLGPCTTPWMTPSGMSVLLPSKEGCAKIVDALFLDQELLAEEQ